METNVYFLIISRSAFLRLRNVSDKVVEKVETHFIFSTTFSRIRPVYEIKLRNIVERDMPQITIWYMHIAWWIPKAINTHSEYVKLTAFHCKNGCTKAPQCYIIRTSPVLLQFICTECHIIPSGLRWWCYSLRAYTNTIKGEGKMIPLQARCGPEGGYRYSSTLPWPRH